jgi:Ig-like domain from next to BRCA1 gene
MKTKIYFYTLLMSVLLTSCAGASTELTATPVDIGAIQTSVFQTVVAPITQTAAAFTPPPTVTEVATLTLEPSQSPTPAGTPTPIICDQMLFVSDVSVPDGSTMTAGQEFVKTWKVKNTGPCTWTTNYSIVFSYPVNGQMGGKSTPLAAEVPPNTEAEISITLKAPTKPGTYSSYWVLSNNNNFTFGTRLSVVIIVP